MLSVLLLEVAFWGTIVAVLTLHSWYALLLPTVIALPYWLMGKSSPLIPTNPAAVAISHRWSLVQFVVVIALFATACFVFGTK